MPDFKAEVRIQVDDSTSGDIYHQGYTINENVRSLTESLTFTLAPSGQRDLCLDNYSSITDFSVFSNTESEITLTKSTSAFPALPFTEHFSIQSSVFHDVIIKNTSSVTGTYKVFFSGE